MSQVRIKSTSTGDWLAFDFDLERDGTFSWRDGALRVQGHLVSNGNGEGWLDVDGHITPFAAVRVKNRIHVWARGRTWWLELAAPGASAAALPLAGSEVVAPMPGTILKIDVAEGAEVTVHQPLLVMESMKMELTLPSPRDGCVAQICVKVGDLVEMGTPLVKLVPEEATPQ